MLVKAIYKYRTYGSELSTPFARNAGQVMESLN